MKPCADFFHFDFMIGHKQSSDSEKKGGGVDGGGVEGCSTLIPAIFKAIGKKKVSLKGRFRNLFFLKNEILIYADKILLNHHLWDSSLCGGDCVCRGLSPHCIIYI